MIGLKELIYTTLTGDTGLTTIVGNNIYMNGVDQIESFPAVAIDEVGAKTITYPHNSREILMQISIWSQNNVEEVENISTRIWTLLNYMKTQTSLNEDVFWSLEDSSVDNNDKERLLYSKIHRFRFWVVGV